MLVYVQILVPVATKMQTIENHPEKYLTFQASAKVFIGKDNMRIKSTLI